jgi:hypothetical protein
MHATVLVALILLVFQFFVRFYDSDLHIPFVRPKCCRLRHYNIIVQTLLLRVFDTTQWSGVV